ncbi:MAG: hypothetical protein PF689_06920 [Deltaproteobacteria bacterium]|nr:hypothetical protein [Deltaproteobacteria bacterium]
MKSNLIFVFICALLFGCSTKSEVLPSFVPESISFLASDDKNNRIYHEITGPTWETPNVSVEDQVFILQNGWLDSQNQLNTKGLDEPAAYIAGTPLEIKFDFRFANEKDADNQPVKLDLKLILDSQYTDIYAGKVLAIKSFPLTGMVSDATTLKISTDNLPQIVDVYQLTIEYSLEKEDGEKENYFTRHLLPVSLQRPIAGTPVYHRSMLWASKWAAGFFLPDNTEEEENDEDMEELEHQISLKMIRGVFGLEEEGYSYGPFPRPEEKDNRAHVFLDFKRTACSEYRGILMALIEYHGIDAQWLTMSFNNYSSSWYSMYETRKIRASGREAQVWRHYNHVVVMVNGRIYDAVYNIWGEDFVDYEDNIFASYCYGEDEECVSPDGWCNYPPPDDRPCLENPPGFDESLGMSITTGERY